MAEAATVRAWARGIIQVTMDAARKSVNSDVGQQEAEARAENVNAMLQVTVLQADDEAIMLMVAHGRQGAGALTLLE